MITDPVEQWLYFFRRARDSTVEELASRLPDPVFAEATGVLEMIAKDPEERRLDNEERTTVAPPANKASGAGPARGGGRRGAQS